MDKDEFHSILSHHLGNILHQAGAFVPKLPDESEKQFLSRHGRDIDALWVFFEKNMEEAFTAGTSCIINALMNMEGVDRELLTYAIQTQTKGNATWKKKKYGPSGT